MRARFASLHHQRGSRGFTVVELLLTIVLVSLLAGAIIFSITGPDRNTDLDDGTERFETLLRFARAHAASTGRKVRIVFEQNDAETSEGARRMVLLWEPDPLGRPGVFEPVPGQTWTDLASDGSIAFESARVVHGAAASSEPADRSDETDAAAFAPSPITFFPDGSSDSVEVVIASRHPEDARKFSVRLAGLTGSIRRQLVVE
jgi:prepilin-type N-terminal cleavage/methylation domain-containing protein